MNWTAEQIKTLTEMFAAGARGSDIATALGSVSRSAVMGKLNRLGIKRGLTAPATLASVVPRKREKKRTAWFLLLRKDLKGRFDLKPPPTPLEKTGPVSIIELEQHHCRFPLDGGLYCGVTAVAGKSYCPDHCRFCYVPRR